MTPDPAVPKQPPHPIGHLTTYELRDYRRELEHALKGISPCSPVLRELCRRLDEVIAEQENRALAAKAPVHA
jgi:hypothetical protein